MLSLVPMKPDFHTTDLNDTATAYAHHNDAFLRRAYWLFALLNKRWLVRIGGFLAKAALRMHLPVEGIIRSTVFRHFCGGETIEECQITIRRLREFGVKTILDYSAEGKNRESSFDETLEQVLSTIELAAQSDDIAFAVLKVTGIGRASLLDKKQSGVVLTDEETTEFERIRERSLRLCKRAAECGVSLFFDAEESWIQQTIDELCYTMMEKFNREKAIVYNTYQLYRKDMTGNLILAHEKARQKGYFLGAKIVRGAYMEKEAARALKAGYPNPIHPSKEETDRAFNEAVLFSLKHLDRIALCVATHNEESCRLCMREMDRLNIDKNDKRVYFAQLLGMSDNISFNMALAGYNVAKYVPFGPIPAVMPYLLRRAHENSAIAGQTSREYYLIRKELLRRKKR